MIEVVKVEDKSGFIPQVAKFELVCLDAFLKFFDLDKNDAESQLVERMAELYNEMSELKPKRSTKGSAGYDFVTPISIDLEVGQSVVIPTCYKSDIANGWVLQIYPRSGLGFKYKLRLANTTGIIDSDYYGNPDNDGHILVKITNEGDKHIHIEKGERFCQGIFVPFGITVDDEANELRKSGIGSTGL